MPSESGIRIVVDAMGGDHAPSINVEGAALALQADPELAVTLVGRPEALDPDIVRLGLKNHPRLTVVPATDVISMEDHAASSIRKKKDSSIHVGLSLIKEGKGHAFVSAGNSGAVMAGAALLLGRLPSVERPAIVLRIPTAEGYIIILDGGANVDCRPAQLAQFALMGSIYAETIEGIASPRVGLLANGSESHKGNELTRETHTLLSQQKELRYQGYVEGFDLFRGTVDVVVCDGFVGNVILKTCEGLAETTFRWFRAEIKRDPMGLLGIAFMKKILKRFRQKFDYQPYGAAPLLGIDGMVLISHGSSTEVAIQNGIRTAKRGVESNFVRALGARLGAPPEKEGNP